MWERNNTEAFQMLQVLGNREMKLKYLNTNLVFVISGTAAQTDDFQESTLNVQLIDTITGQVLYSQSLQVIKPLSLRIFHTKAILYWAWHLVNNYKPPLFATSTHVYKV